MLGARAWLPKSALLAKKAFVPAAKWLKLGIKLLTAWSITTTVKHLLFPYLLSLAITTNQLKSH